MVLDNTLINSSVIILLILIPSVILHEVVHGLVADRLGDPTARLLGRITLNPLPHIDPFMTIIVPLLLFVSSHGAFIFGAAKPVPVDPFNLRDGRKDMAIVSLAGPATNILIAVIFALLIKIIFATSVLSGLSQYTVLFILKTMVKIVELNLLLGFFNLIPIPPLDGSKVFALILPEKEASAYLSIGYVGIFIIFFLLSFPIGGFSLESVMSNLLMFSEHLLGL